VLLACMVLSVKNKRFSRDTSTSEVLYVSLRLVRASPVCRLRSSSYYSLLPRFGRCGGYEYVPQQIFSLHVDNTRIVSVPSSGIHRTGDIRAHATYTTYVVITALCSSSVDEKLLDDVFPFFEDHPGRVTSSLHVCSAVCQ
jgi:hypothetical protein